MIKNRAPCQVWGTRRDMSGGYVRTMSDDCILIFEPGLSKNGQSIVVDRAEARLLARRINECLDATVKR